MSRFKVFYDNGEQIFYKINTLDDLLDLQRFSTYRFKKFHELLGYEDSKNRNNERAAKRKAKAVVSDLIKMIATEMIEENMVYIFPMRNFGYMRVANMTNKFPDKEIKNHYHQMKVFGANNGKYYCPVIILSDLVKYANGNKYYRVRFSRVFNKKLGRCIINGNTYN